MKFLNLAHGLDYRNIKLPSLFPTIIGWRWAIPGLRARDGRWMAVTTNEASPWNEESNWNKNSVLQGDIILKRTSFNAIRPSIFESEVLMGLGGATCPPSLCSFTVEHVRGSPPASQLSSASSVAKLLRFWPSGQIFPPNKL